MNRNGPGYGYHPKASKSCLIVKEAAAEEVRRLFSGTGVQITREGKRLLGAAIGNNDFEEKFPETIISPLVQQVSKLAEVAQSQHQAAHAAFTHGLIGKWTFLTRTSSSSIAKHLQPLEDAIRLRLIPSLTGCSPPGNDERDLLALPPRLGGLGLVNPRKEVAIEQANSQHVTAPLVTHIGEQNENISDIKEEMKQRKREAHSSKCKHQQEAATALKSELPAALLRSAEFATEEGASSWITAIPLDRYGFTLHRGAYRDALCLRYSWSPPILASQCVCGQLFTIAHALSCPTGGYPSICHNELRDITADLLIFANVCLITFI